MSITTLRCIGGPYGGRTIDVNDRMLLGDLPIDIIVPADRGALTAKRIGEYHVRVIDGHRVLSWVEAPNA